MPKIDLRSLPHVTGTGYPPPHDRPVAGRSYQRLTAPAGLADFAVNIVTLAPGAWSSQRHWHEEEDEFAVILSGQATLIDDSGETPLGPGECVSFPKGDANGHHLVNRSEGDVVFLVIGHPDSPGACRYPDVDLDLDGVVDRYRHKDGRFWGEE